MAAPPSSMAIPERREAPYWVRISIFVIIMMTATWLALWGASKSGDHRPATSRSRNG
jgi:hypothetical protein